MSIQSKFSARRATPLDPRALRAFAAGIADRALVVQAASGLLVVELSALLDGVLP